jgi:hypothetical protein
MSEIQKFIRENREKFDDSEPLSGHFERFAARLNEQPAMQPRTSHRSPVLKVAAIIVVLISVSVFIIDFATREIRERFAIDDNSNELPAEIREAMQYYENQSNTKIATMHQLAANRQDADALNASAFNEIRSLDATTSELKKSLAENPGNERILDAIIQNQQMKETMLNTIISKLSDSKK